MWKVACTAVIVVLFAAGCSSPSAGPGLSPGEELTSVACHRVNAVMAPKSGAGPQTITWDESQPSHSPLAVMADAVHRSPNATLHTELSAFEAAAEAGNVLGTNDAANFMVRTCQKLGFG
jgi:hypothetical protein